LFLLGLLALVVSMIAIALLMWKAASTPCVEYATVRVPARVVERGRRLDGGGATVIPAHDEVVCVKRSP
jgi:hypothetical protein